MKRATNIQQNVKTAEMFGGFNIFATLSLIAQTRAYTLLRLAGTRVNKYMAFLASMQEKPYCFCALKKTINQEYHQPNKYQ